MTNTIRCPACRGAKKVPKLGGMIGECNTCTGKGTILGCDKPPKAVPVTLEDVISQELVNAVADSVIPTDRVIQKIPAAVNAVSPNVKIDGKQAIYKRKRA